MMNAFLDAASTRYIETAQRFPPLSREEETELVARARAGDRRATDRLVEAHLRDVVYIARKHRYYGMPLSDLIGEGVLGLMRALEKFEPQRGVRISTYAAHWIRSFIVSHVLRSWTLVGGRTGVLRSNLFFRLRRERARLECLHGSGSQLTELLAQRLNVSEEDLGHMVERLDGRDLSLDAPSHPDSPSLGESLTSADDAEEDYEAKTRRHRVAAALQKALPKLDARERFIAEARLLADSTDELSLADIGRKLGVSRERARQLETRARAKIRQAFDECQGGADPAATAA
ncbi:MAG TPA: sigma-70 family RNA polymerase sigma factor [Polyangiaceae bacterium]|nr:sigma-70 family RNA polymerase sigma factor [Polyangiaceae bacterium]